MIASLRAHRKRAIDPSATLAREGIATDFLTGGEGYGAVTLHRPSNVDEPHALAESLAILREVANRVPLIWPVHPRTRLNIERFELTSRLAGTRIALLPPQGYLEMLGLLVSARLVLTDSGGIQEETTALAVPCLTMRENTERPVTVEEGTNTVVGRDRGRVLACVDDIIANGGKRGRIPQLWDGRASTRIAADLDLWLAKRVPATESAAA